MKDETTERSQRGFTLIELLIAIVVVGILTAVAIVGIAGLTDNGKAAACRASLDSAKTASAVHFANTNAYPANFGVLTQTPRPELDVPTGATVGSLTISGRNSSWTLPMTPNGGNPDYTVSFGTVDALAINAPTCGSVFAPAVPGTDSAIYWSDYSLKPVFTGQSTSNNTITAKVTTNFTAADISVVRDSINSPTVPTAAGDFAPVSTGTADIIATNASNGVAINRFIGVAVAPTNGAGTLTGAQTATVTFTLTVQ